MRMRVRSRFNAPRRRIRIQRAPSEPIRLFDRVIVAPSPVPDLPFCAARLPTVDNCEHAHTLARTATAAATAAGAAYGSALSSTCGGRLCSRRISRARPGRSRLELDTSSLPAPRLVAHGGGRSTECLLPTPRPSRLVAHGRGRALNACSWSHAL